MEILSARHGDTLVLSPRGRIDHAGAEGFKTAWFKDPDGNILCVATH